MASPTTTTAANANNNNSNNNNANNDNNANGNNANDNDCGRLTTPGDLFADSDSSMLGQFRLASNAQPAD